MKIEFNKFSGKYKITIYGKTFVSDGRKSFITFVNKVAGITVPISVPLFAATKKQVSITEKSITCKYSGFPRINSKISLITTVSEISENQLRFSLKVDNEKEGEIKNIFFPEALNSEVHTEGDYAVESLRQGALVPDGYKRNKTLTMAFTNVGRKIGSGSCYMPLYGRHTNGMTYSAIIETPYDAAVFSSKGSNDSFLTSVIWESSLKKIGYERSIIYTFHNCGDYNTVAKDYRRYIENKGELKTIKQKFAENPNIERLIGTPLLHNKIYECLNKQSNMYKSGGINERLYSTFENRAQQLQKLKDLGLKKLYIHTDGWGENGYDHGHPNPLPICKKAGGSKGLKKLLDKTKELSYLFAFHDQYRDFYLDSSAYDEKKRVIRANGSIHYEETWDGGPQTILCTTFAPYFVKNTYDKLENQGIKPDGVYLDVFSALPGDECLDENHKITREQSVEYRRACCKLLNDRGIIVSSEEGGFHLINSVALIHHAPYYEKPQYYGEPYGIPIPLFNLVYHDCLFIPWGYSLNWGIPKGESAHLHCALNAGMPVINPFGRETIKLGKDLRPNDYCLIADDKLKKEIEKVNKLAEISKRLYDKELIQFKLCTNNGKIQKNYYSDGTVIKADFEIGRYEAVFPNGEVISGFSEFD